MDCPHSLPFYFRSMEIPFSEMILRNKLNNVRITLLNNLWNVMAHLENCEDHAALLGSFTNSIAHMRRDLRSWPLSHPLKMAIRRLDNILGVVKDFKAQCVGPDDSMEAPNYEKMEVKIKIKARYIK